MALYSSINTILIVEDKKAEVAALQKSSDAVLQWTQLWKREVNPEKCTHVSFTERTDRHNYLSLGGNTLYQEAIVLDIQEYTDDALSWKMRVQENKKITFDNELRSLSIG